MADFPPLGGPTGGGAASGPGPGWWQASDGNWYPPEQQPGYATPSYGMPTGYGYGYGVQASAATNGWAIASLVVSLISCGIGSLLGVIFGHVAMNQIKRTGGGGRGLAIAGLVIGYLGLALLIVAIIAVIAVGESTNDFNNDFGNDFGGIVGAFA